MFHFRLRAVFAAVLLNTFFLIVPSFAATFTFAGPDPADANPGDPTDWFNAKNWRPNGVPGASDSVEIPGGTVNIGNKNVSVQGLNLAGTLTGTTGGRVAITSPSNWTGGTIQSVAIAVPLNIPFNISGTGNKVLDGAVISNSGLVIWAGPGPIVGSNGALILNQITGIFDMRADGIPFVYNNVGAKPAFKNIAGPNPLSGGILRKSQGNATTTISGWEFFLSNTVDVRTGIMEFNTLNLPR